MTYRPLDDPATVELAVAHRADRTETHLQRAIATVTHLVTGEADSMVTRPPATGTSGISHT